jgi:hypothetical protein
MYHDTYQVANYQIADLQQTAEHERLARRVSNHQPRTLNRGLINRAVNRLMPVAHRTADSLDHERRTMEHTRIARRSAYNEKHLFETSSHPRAALVVAGGAIALLIAFTPFTSSAVASGNYGPDTCLQGYVWRNAVPGDHVCVTGATRAETAYDDSQAAARRSSTGGAYGPDTCIQGYVWREAVRGDHVCVTPATRAQAAHDASQAASRRDSLHVWDTVYWVNTGSGGTCSGDACTTTQPSAYPALGIHADHVNVGSVVVALRSIGTNALLRSWRVYAKAAGYTPGGRLDLNSGDIYCLGMNVDSYLTILDPSSGRWSAPHPVATRCAVL